MSIYKKIGLVMQDVNYLSKDGKIAFGKTNYKAITEEKVTSVVRESLIKHGLVIIPVEQEHHKVDNLSTVNVKYKIVDLDTGEYELVVSSGTGVDTQDKGVGKAMTYAYKYMLLRTFAIPTGEDPDKISSDEWDDKLKKQPKSNKATEIEIKTLKNLLDKIGGNYEQQILDFNKIEKLEDLTKTQYGKAMVAVGKKLNK